MIIYKVTGHPILVRQIPSADGRVINVVPVDGLVYALSEDSGWIRTSSGYYVFHTDDLSVYVNNAPVPQAKITRMMATRGGGGSFGPNIEGAVDDDIYGNYDVEDPEVVGIDSTKRDSSYGLETSDKLPSGSAQQAQENALDKYRGSAVKVSSSVGKVYKIDPKTGQRIGDAVDLPDELTKDGNMSVFYGTSSDGQMAKVMLNDTMYEVPMVSVNMSSVNNGEINYNASSELYAMEMGAREAQTKSVLQEIYSTIGSVVSGFGAAAQLEVTPDEIRSIFGFPYQYLATTDPRVATGGQDPSKIAWYDNTQFGRKFLEKIVSRAPILVMQPGEAVFLRGYSDKDKNTVIGALGASNDNDSNKSELDSILSGGGEYYSFTLKKEEYYKAVDEACRAAAVLLGIGDVTIPALVASTTTKINSTLRYFNWERNCSFAVAGAYAGAVQFYINSDAQIQENISTQTRASQLAAKMNQVSDQAMEVMFVSGGLAGNFGGDVGKAATDLIGGGSDQNSNSSGLLTNVINNLGSLLSGGRMYFPDIWSDSQFSRSYNVTIKLDSPDCDLVSIYLNIIVPLLHILAFCLPRSSGDNTYISPFLVRCFYKSMFHIDNGIITSCDIAKGDQGCWTQDGLPTQITVTLGIKDLYTIMSQSTGNGNNTLLSNPAQLDYIANLCGINIAPASFTRSLMLWKMIKANRITDPIVSIPSRFLTNTYRVIQNIASHPRHAM